MGENKTPTFGSDLTQTTWRKKSKKPTHEIHPKNPSEETTHNSTMFANFLQILTVIQNWLIGSFNYLKLLFQNIETTKSEQLTPIEESSDEEKESSLLESPIDSETESFRHGSLRNSIIGGIEEENEDSKRYQDESSSDGENEEMGSVETVDKIRSQVELMFSDEHLAKDGFLLKHVRRRSDGFVSLKLIAGLRKVKQISREFQTVLDSLQTSEKLQVNGEGTKVRRLNPLTPFLQTLPISSKNQDKNANVTGKYYYRRSSSMEYGSYSSGAENSDDPSQKYAPYKYRKNSFPNKYQQWNRKQSGNMNYQYYNWQNSDNLNFNQQQQMFRRRGGSLPVQPENTILALDSSLLSNLPNGCKKEESELGRRAKSFSYYEGAEAATNLMNPWLRRRQSSWRNSDSSLAPTSAIRQPLGPDGSKGFSNKRNSINFPIFEPYD